MGKKILLILVICGLVVFTYVMMLAMQPATNELVSTANASGNWTNSPETQALIVSYPLWQWVIPGFIGLVAIVGVWLKKE